MNVNEHERLSNITLRQQLVVRTDMDVNEHERLSNIPLRQRIVSHVHLHPYLFLLQAVV
jgi:hypothetical protein